MTCTVILKSRPFFKKLIVFSFNNGQSILSVKRKNKDEKILPCQYGRDETLNFIEPFSLIFLL